MIVISATYRQSSKRHAGVAGQQDPENRLLARGPRFRLSAELIRDQALAASGLLVEKIGGPSVKPYQPAGLVGGARATAGAYHARSRPDGLYRRTCTRSGSGRCRRRHDELRRGRTARCAPCGDTRTNTPLQALVLLNDVTYVEAARKLAERMMREAASTRAGGSTSAYGLGCLARPPKPRGTARC